MLFKRLGFQVKAETRDSRKDFRMKSIPEKSNSPYLRNMGKTVKINPSSLPIFGLRK
jgi:hypothetical protein